MEWGSGYVNWDRSWQAGRLMGRGGQLGERRPQWSHDDEETQA